MVSEPVRPAGACDSGAADGASALGAAADGASALGAVVAAPDEQAAATMDHSCQTGPRGDGFGSSVACYSSLE